MKDLDEESLIRTLPLSPALVPSQLFSHSPIRASHKSQFPTMPKPFRLPNFWLL